MEVKYRKKQLDGYFLQDTQALSQSWPHAHIFLATPDDFFMGSCAYILENRGSILPLTECNFIDHMSDNKRKIVKAYHELLKEVLGIDQKPEGEPPEYNPRDDIPDDLTDFVNETLRELADELD